MASASVVDVVGSSEYYSEGVVARRDE